MGAGLDFEKARFNMVEQQVRPWDVLDQSVLDLLFVVKREDFVPAPYRALVARMNRVMDEIEAILAKQGK